MPAGDRTDPPPPAGPPATAPCPQCGAAVSPEALGHHLRTAHQLVRYRGLLFPVEDALDTVLAAALGYFELVFAQGTVGIAKESLRINSDYEQQIGHAVDAGIAFKGDALRVSVQKQRSQLAPGGNNC